MFASKSLSETREDSIKAAEAAAKDLDDILEGLPEGRIDDEEEDGVDGDGAGSGSSRQSASQHVVKYQGSSDENELEDIIEEEESEDEDEAKQVGCEEFYQILQNSANFKQIGK